MVLVLALKVERDVPIPESISGALTPAFLPWDEMRPGDSFFIPESVCPANLTGNPKHQYAWEKRCENGVEGTRVWRVF